MRKMISELKLVTVVSWWGCGPGNSGKNDSDVCGLILKYSFRINQPRVLRFWG